MKTGKTLILSTLFQIFVESLLCSSRLQNIRLAGEMMERSAEESSEPQYVEETDGEPSIDSKVQCLLRKCSFLERKIEIGVCFECFFFSQKDCFAFLNVSPKFAQVSTLFVTQLAYSEAVPLVLSAAREYFDSSANLSDSSMALARYASDRMAHVLQVFIHPPPRKKGAWMAQIRDVFQDFDTAEQK